MTLKRQLLLVSLLALMLPWAGCEYIRQTESALRAGQQQWLTGTARALANSVAQYRQEYPDRLTVGRVGEQLFLQPLSAAPELDGFADDWLLEEGSFRSLRGTDGPVKIALGFQGTDVYLFVDVRDRSIVFSTAATTVIGDGPDYADRIALVSNTPPYPEDRFIFMAEAPGALVSFRRSELGLDAEPAIAAHWQDVPGGYRLEARIPAALLGTNLGVIVGNVDDASRPPTRTSSYSSPLPAMSVQPSETLQVIAESLVQPGMRLIITDSSGWRIAVAGELSAATTANAASLRWSNRIYELLVEGGEAAESAEPDASGREQRTYVSSALAGRESASWFRSRDNGRAIVAVAAPILHDGDIVGTLILQQGTDAILSLTNQGLARLINLTLIATLLVVGTLVGYASWLSKRIRRLSLAAEQALETESLQAALPSSLANDEIGDLSRSFSSVLQQLGEYNEYLRTLASKLSHELRTPLAIVTSSLENLEHEPLNEASAGYTARAKDGADRLRRILSAMSEASRVEELMKHADPERFDIGAVVRSAVDAYRDVYNERRFEFDSEAIAAPMTGSPELLIQMLDKLVDNAVSFSKRDDTIHISLQRDDQYRLSIYNPGPQLPEQMRSQLFDSMVSMRGENSTHHLGLGLYIAKLIAEGHSGSISAHNVDGGVAFEVSLPSQDSR